MNRRRELFMGSMFALLAGAQLSVWSSDVRAEAVALARFKTDGELDTTFGSDGTFVGNTPGEALTSVAIDPVSGKIVAAGHSGQFLLIERFNTNGTLDSSFGAGGKEVVDYPDIADEEAAAVAVTSSSKVVVVGTNSKGVTTVTRLTSGGQLDTSFGSGGGTVQTTPWYVCSAAGSLDPSGLVLDSSGQSYISATVRDTQCSGVEYFAVLRIKTDGTRDLFYGQEGYAIGYFTQDLKNHQGAWGIAMAPNGKIVAAGWYRPGNGRFSFGVMRYNTNGVLDTTFDNDGRDLIDFSSCADEFIRDVKVTSSNQIVTAGYGLCDNVYNFAVARENAGGGLDTSFDQDGKVLLTTWSGIQATSLALAGTKPVVAGTAFLSGSFSRFMVARFNADGTHDNSFHDDGMRTLSFAGHDAMGEGMVLDSSSKIIIVGRVN